MKTKKQFLFNPDNPKKSFDVYIDKDPSDTIPIKYTTFSDVKNTIKKLELLYAKNKYSHKRIWQVGMILYVRLKVYHKKRQKVQHYNLAKKYFKFLGQRTKIKGETQRKKFKFKFSSNKNKSKSLKGGKKKYPKINMNNIPFSQFKSKRLYLLNKCGMPDIPETQHCFNDATHHTCCELSEEARKYADETNNPIGKLAEDVFKKLPKNHPMKNYYKTNKRVPWCTCFGSKVCGAYGDKFNQQTKINFISSPNKNKYARSIHGSQGCEEHVRNKFTVLSHKTPGINSTNKECSGKNKNKIKYKHF